MKLYLVQHGEAVPKEVDPERPLTGEGHQDLVRLAALLGATGISVGRALHSGKLRARQSAGLLVAAIAPGLTPLAVGGLDPNDPVGQLAAQVEVWAEDTLLVGHLPFLGRLVGQLLTGDAEAALVAFRPGTAVCLERGEQGRWQLVWMLRPELLPRS